MLLHKKQENPKSLRKVSIKFLGFILTKKHNKVIHLLVVKEINPRMIEDLVRYMWI